MQLKLFNTSDRRHRIIPLSLVNKKNCPGCGCEKGTAKLTPDLVHFARVDCHGCGFFLGWLSKKYRGLVQW